jgi:hypothetical protein
VGLAPGNPPSKLVSVLVAWDPTVALEPAAVATNCKGVAEAEVETPCEVLGHSPGAHPPLQEIAQAQCGVRKDEHRRLRRKNPVSQSLQQKIKQTTERSYLVYVVVTVVKRERDTFCGAAGERACTAWPGVGHSGAVRETYDGVA